MLIKLHLRMLGLAKTHHLPVAYKEDLDDDLRILKNFKGKCFVWLLRTNGSTLVPIGVGADPIHITHWLFSNHGQRILAFQVDSKLGTIEKITFTQAEKLIQQLPLEISTLFSPKDTTDGIAKVLEDGLSGGVWGVFSSPNIGSYDWEKWRTYFATSGNDLMKSFMDKAIRLRSSFSHERRSVA